MRTHRTVRLRKVFEVISAVTGYQCSFVIISDHHENCLREIWRHPQYIITINEEEY